MSFLLLRSFSWRHLTSRSSVRATSFLKVGVSRDVILRHAHAYELRAPSKLGTQKFLSAHELLASGESFMHHFDVISWRHVLEHIGSRAWFTPPPPYESCTPARTGFSLLGIVVTQFFGHARASEHKKIITELPKSGIKYFNYVLMNFYYKWAYLFEFWTFFGHFKCFLDKMDVLHLSMSLILDGVDFTQLYSTLK